MFTGLIREMAEVSNFSNNILTVKAIYQPKIGDSIAINGACLTVVAIDDSMFSVELSPESQSILAMENYKGSVHMEPAMMMGDRFEGHIVQGHIDCLGTITNIIQNGNSTDFFISIPSEYMKYVISKGSICVDGISLTVNEVKKDEFRLTIIPHTLENTLFKTYMINSKVNIETDMFARYVFNMFKKSEGNENISWDTVDNIMSNY
ncbi:MAG: riboflavin synthase [Arcobacteraceae bacterium]